MQLGRVYSACGWLELSIPLGLWWSRTGWWGQAEEEAAQRESWRRRSRGHDTFFQSLLPVACLLQFGSPWTPNHAMLGIHQNINLLIYIRTPIRSLLSSAASWWPSLQHLWPLRGHFILIQQCRSLSVEMTCYTIAVGSEHMEDAQSQQQ